jgi:hypothetical protein
MSKSERLILFAAGLFIFPSAALAGSVNAVWTGGDSSSVWTDALNWNPNGIPNNGADTFSVSITSTAYNPVTLGTNTTINQLIMAGTSLSLSSPSVTLNLVSGPSSLTNATLTGGSLVVGDSLQGSGTIEPYALTNNGSIIANQSSPLYVIPSSSLTNSGLMTATDGAGLILATPSITNTGGTISANGANSLVGFSPSPSTTLTGGTVEAVNGGTVDFQGAAQGATLNAGANSNLTLIGAQVTGGAVNVNATGSLNLWTSPSSINSTLSNYGIIAVDAATTAGGAMTNYAGGVINVNGSSLSLQAGGAYTNNGAINLNSATLELAGSGTVSVGGSGTLNMNGSGSGIVSTAAGQTFDNGAGHTIQGGGTIEPYALTNEGSIIANIQSSLLLVTPSSSVTNSGLMTATGGAGLILQTGNITNTGGMISANGANSFVAVVYPSTTLTGGTVEAVNGGEIQLDSVTQGATLNAGASSNLTMIGAQVTGGAVDVNATGTLNLWTSPSSINSTLSNYGIIAVDAATTVGGAMTNYSGGVISVNGSSLSLQAGGTYTNNGAINLNSATLELAGSGTVSLSGSGTLNLNGSGSSIIASGYGQTFDNGAGHTIQGSGIIEPSSALTNEGSIIANTQSSLLSVMPASVTNSGLMTATGGAGMIFQTGSITNTGGMISANGANSFVAVVNPSTTLTGGTVEAVNGGTFQLDSVTQGATLNAGASSNLTLIGAQVTGGAVNVNATGTLNLWTSPSSINSTLSNYGAIVVDAATTVGGAMTNYSGGVINVNGSSLSLQAGGTYTNNGAINLNSATLKLQGSGTVSLSGSGTLNMNGSGSGIFSTAAGQTFDNGAGHTIQGGGTIEPYALTNEGTITAAGSALLTIDSTSITNDGTFGVEAGSALALGSSPFSNYSGNTLTGGTYAVAGAFEFQGADIVTNQADLQLSESWYIANGLGGSGTTNLTENGTNGSFDLQNGAVFGTSQQFTNEGNVIVGPGSTFDALASGSSAYLQTAGTTLVDGTLTGNVDLEGGSLSGSGEVDGNLYNAMAVDPGDAPGTLLISGNYTQTAGGVLNIELLNAVVYDQLKVLGSAQLGGTADVTLLPGYVLDDGDVFTILMCSSVSGAFSAWDLPVLANGYWTTFIDANGVELQYDTPEPAAWSMVAAGALWLWWRKRSARNAA